MKKRIWAVATTILLIATIGVGSAVYAAGGLPRIFSHGFIIQVEPIEIGVIEVSNLLIRPGESVTVIYEVINYSQTTDHNLVAEQNTGIESQWTLGNTQYLPGTPFMIGKGQKMTIKIIFYPESTGEVPVEISIFRLSSEQG